MAKRGEILREHILWTARDVLLEQGVDRTSMDMVASRAGTTKRSIYAHFENKKCLVLAILDLVRRNLLQKLRAPQEYSNDPVEALTIFCARYAEIMLHKGSIELCRFSSSESVRFPEQGTKCFELLFAEPNQALCDYLAQAFVLTKADAETAAHKLVSRIVHPRFTRALFGMDTLVESFDPVLLSPDIDLAPTRLIVTEVVRDISVRA